MPAAARPDAFYEIPRERIAKISKRDKFRQQAEAAMGKYDIGVELAVGGEPLIVAEVVDLTAHQAVDSDGRMGSARRARDLARRDLAARAG